MSIPVSSRQGRVGDVEFTTHNENSLIEASPSARTPRGRGRLCCHRVPIVAFALALAPARCVTAAPEGAERLPTLLRAVPRDGTIRIDGRLDEHAWQAATPFSGLAQVFPDGGAAPSEHTEVRVLYDESMVFVGVRCSDSRSAEIIRPLGRRDSPPAGDLVRVYLDFAGDGRTAAMFVLTAGGVVADALVYDDDQVTYEWDAVWEAAAAIDEDGWSGEFAIPRAVLADRSTADEQRLRFGLQREIGRTHERMATMDLPRNARGLVSRLGWLEGIPPRTDRGSLEFAPYSAARTTSRPRFSDPARPTPLLQETSASVGVDFRARPLSTLSLAGTVNPDFSQVEADQLILNLSNTETLFPEKRPFFMHDMGLFKAVGEGNEDPPLRLFYSRRIGLDTPILAAAKLSGQVGDHTDVALLDAFVAGTSQPADATEASASSAFRWSAAQPFTFGPASSFPLGEQVPRNYVAGVIRTRIAEGLVLGATATSVVPFSRACRAADAGDASCAVRAGHALAADFTATSRDREWYGYGQVTASVATDGPPARVLEDGTRLVRGDVGAGAYVRMGRRGGEPWRFDLSWSYATPLLDLTPSGYQLTQNWQYAGATLKYTRPSGAGPFHEYTAWLEGWLQWTTDGRGLVRGNGAILGVDALLKAAYLRVGCTFEVTDQGWDVRDIKLARGTTEGSGIPVQRPVLVTPTCKLETDATRRLVATVSGAIGRVVATRPYGGGTNTVASAELLWRPHPRVETDLVVAFDRHTYPVRYVDGAPPGPLLLARLDAPTTSVTIRQVLVLFPRLVLQLHAQLFTAYGSYGPFYTAEVHGRDRIRFTDLLPADLRDPRFTTLQSQDFAETVLVLNSTLRWEYRPGSTLYLIYARHQDASPISGQAPHNPMLPQRLGGGPTSNSFLIKVTYFFR